VVFRFIDVPLSKQSLMIIRCERIERIRQMKRPPSAGTRSNGSNGAAA
jgi:hypothetical protein